MTFLTQPETPANVITYILRQQIKEAKRYKPTEPYHGRRKCEDISRCLFHGRK
jgi:hypothetical protein